jgi:hypothetical protein
MAFQYVHNRQQIVMTETAQDAGRLSYASAQADSVLGAQVIRQYISLLSNLSKTLKGLCTPQWIQGTLELLQMDLLTEKSTIAASTKPQSSVYVEHN